jgi:hypothetical protein
VKLAGWLTVPVLTAIAALVVLLALRPLSTSRALAIWLVLVTGLALVLLVRHSGTGGERRRGRFEAALRGKPATTPVPVDLLRMERELELGIAGAGNAYHRLLPLLRSAAAARLATRHGIELDRHPDAARAVLGEDAWELLRPDRPEPADRFAPGVARARVTTLIERVESL